MLIWIQIGRYFWVSIEIPFRIHPVKRQFLSAIYNRILDIQKSHLRNVCDTSKLANFLTDWCLHISLTNKTKDYNETLDIYALIISEIVNQDMKISSILKAFDKFDCHYSELNKNRRNVKWWYPHVWGLPWTFDIMDIQTCKIFLGSYIFKVSSNFYFTS